MQLSDAEWKVMNAVWDRRSATARDVLEDLGDETGWAYTTVKTMLSRLVEKGALKVKMRANRSVYEPLLSLRHARSSAVKALMEKAFDGAFGPMVHFLLRDEKLSRKERAALKRLIEAEGK